MITVASILLLVFRRERVSSRHSEMEGSFGHFARTSRAARCSRRSSLYLARKRPFVPKYGKSQWQLVRERFVRSPQAQVGFFFVATFSFVAIVATYLAPL